MADDHVRRTAKLLDYLLRVEGLSREEMDRRLSAPAGTTESLLAGAAPLELDQVLAMLAALEVDPSLFFRALFPEPAAVEREGKMMERFFARLHKAGYSEEPIPALPDPPAAPEELEKRIEGAIEDALAGLDPER